MNYDVLWELFKKTGDIKYYNLLQLIKKKSYIENREF